MRGGCEGEDAFRGRLGAQGVEVGGKFSLDLRKVVFLDGAALGAEAEAVSLHLEEGDGVALFRQGFVEDENAGLHARVGIETARRQRHHGDEEVFYEHLPQRFVGGLALEDDALGDDDAGAAGGREVLGHVVHEQDFAALGLDGEALVGFDAAFRGHEGRVGEDDIGELVPALLGGEGVVLKNVRVGEAVEVEVHQGEAHHVGRDVVALEIFGEAALFVGSEGAVALRIRVGTEDVLVGRNKETSSTAGGVENGLGFLRGDDLDHEIDDMARGAELPGIALTAQDAEEILEGVAEALAVVVTELVDDLEEGLERFGVAVREIGVFKDVAEERGDAWVLGHFGDAFAIEAEHFVAADGRRHKFSPAVAGKVAGEELALAAEFLAFGIHVVHEFVDEGDGDLLNLGLGIGHLAHEDVAGGIDAAFGIGV